jgi:hypothetical protein
MRPMPQNKNINNNDNNNNDKYYYNHNNDATSFTKEKTNGSSNIIYEFIGPSRRLFGNKSVKITLKINIERQYTCS